MFKMRNWQKCFPFALPVLFAFCAIARADEGTRRAQEELRKRNLYFGDVNGEMNTELAGALKKYQMRKGFAPSGQIDEETANSLKIPQTSANNLISQNWPDLPILKSDVARELPEPERIKLELKAEEDPDAVPPPAESPNPGQDLRPEEVTKFVVAYLRDAERDDVDLQVHYYNFPLDYFDHGRVNREFVVKDTRDYVKRWPKRKYTLMGPVNFFAGGNEGETKVEFTIGFTVENSKHVVRGKTRNFWSIIRGENLRIVAVKEQRLHE